MRKFLLSLVCAITAIAVQAQDPAIVMTTTKSINSQFSFGIDAVAPNTPIQIDWGNGVKENFTIGNVTEFFGFPLKGSSVKIWGAGIASLNITSMELTALDVTRATSLTYLYIKTNQITTLDLSSCTALTFVDCTENLLTSLTLPNTSTLVAVNCDNNLLASLNVSGATGITELTCTNNKLTFATLPIKQPTWTTYTYSPQQNFDLPKQTYSTNEEIDLSSQLTVNGNTTNYTWKTVSGTTLISGADYNVTEGKFTFLKTYTESLYCEMTNAIFPSLILKTTNISIPTTPAIIMTTTTTVGSSFSFVIGSLANNTPIQVDWGNGTLANYTIGTSIKNVYGTLTGNTIKIYGSGINYLDLYNKNLTSLDVTNSTALTKLFCDSNQLTALDVNKNTALTELDCGQNQLTALDVTNNGTLTKLNCRSNNLTALNVSKNTALTEFWCNSNQLTALDVTQNIGLKTLECYINKLTALDVSKNTALTVLNCTYNQLTALDVSKNTALTELWCNSNKLTSFDITKNTALTALRCYLNQLTALDVTQNIGLKTLECYNNKLTALDVSKNTVLTVLLCYNNNIKSLDVENLNSLTTLHCYSNGMTSLNVKNCTALSTLYCYYNELTSLNTDGCNSLQYIYCTGNKIVSLNVSINQNLEELGCTDNKLTTIDLTQNTKLKLLGCSDNQLTSINLTSNSLLSRLHLANNQLSVLDLSNNQLINRLDIPGNKLTFSLLPIKTTILTNYTYSPQAKITLAKTDYALNETINLSSEFSVGGNNTSYIWKTIGGVALVKNVDYTESNGIFNFFKQPGDYIFCELRNATFPDLTLTTENISVALSEPILSFTTLAPSASQQTFILKANSNNNNVKVDWGNGGLTNYTVGTSNAYITGTLIGNTVKVYGLGITYADLTNKKINAIEICSSVLTYVDCKSNNLTFSSLPLKQQNWTTYTYSPQNAIVLSKKQYGLTETVDLSSELTVNANTTNYIWKTKAGTTLTAGTDYNTTNGVTTFLKIQTDSVYCQMTNSTFPGLVLKTTNIKVSQFPLSVDDNKVAIKVYPNPATESFTIKMAEEIVRVEVSTLTGVKVFENGLYSSTTVTIPLNTMPKGALLIKAYTRNDVYSGKVVKI